VSISPIRTQEQQRTYRVRTRPIDDPGTLLDRLPAEQPLAWMRRGEGLVGWGVAAELRVRGPERFSRAQRWWNEWCAAADVDDTVSVPGTGPVAFASFAFDEADESVVVLPQVLIGRRGGQAWVTTVGDVDLPSAVASVPQAPTQVIWTDGARTSVAWEQAVHQAIQRIEHGELDKVVLARDVVADVQGPLDQRHLLRNLAHAYPSCWTFAVDNLVGATPELLVRRTGDVVTSRVLAGTVRRQGDENADAGLAQSLLTSGKDLAEHEYAVRSVARALAAHCTDMDVPDIPGVLQLANVQHLVTDITGRLADDASVLVLAASLHPTAAVCGTPTERALAVIQGLEGMNRGRYAGPVGWLDAHGDGEFGIALRCAEIGDQRVRAFAGCGIVAGSDAAEELEESIAKLVPIRDALDARD
jgi:menaquinone-specific isochorismate synthase